MFSVDDRLCVVFVPVECYCRFQLETWLYCRNVESI